MKFQFILPNYLYGVTGWFENVIAMETK